MRCCAIFNDQHNSSLLSTFYAWHFRMRFNSVVRVIILSRNLFPMLTVCLVCPVLCSQFFQCSQLFVLRRETCTCWHVPAHSLTNQVILHSFKKSVHYCSDECVYPVVVTLVIQAGAGNAAQLVDASKEGQLATDETDLRLDAN